MGQKTPNKKAPNKRLPANKQAKKSSSIIDDDDNQDTFYDATASTEQQQKQEDDMDDENNYEDTNSMDTQPDKTVRDHISTRVSVRSGNVQKIQNKSDYLNMLNKTQPADEWETDGGDYEEGE